MRTRAIIFDFNRTLFDPDTRRLVRGARQTLRTCKRKGFQLVLISRQEEGRKLLIQECGLNDYFSRIVFASRKDVRWFRRNISNMRIDPKLSFVVGDRVREEIAVGNALGFKTVWVRQGKFANEMPRSPREKPERTVRDIRHIIRCIA